MKTTKIHEVLAEIADAFRVDRRLADGTAFYRLKDGVDDGGCADWLQRDDAEGRSFMLRVHEALDDRGPDDWVYAMTHAVASDLAESAEYHARHTDDEWDADEAVTCVADTLTDVYTSARLQWLAMNLHNYALCDEAWEELGNSADPSASILDRITAGQYEAIRRIADRVVYEAQREMNERNLRAGHEAYRAKETDGEQG